MSAVNTVLITGGAGFIGSRLAHLLVAKGWKVTILDNLSPQIHGENAIEKDEIKALAKQTRFIHGDVRQADVTKQALEGATHLVHLAAETGTGQSMYQVAGYTDVNCMGTAILMDILVNEANTVRKVVVASSRAIYGEGKYTCATHGIQYPGSRKASDLEKGLFEPLCPVCNAALSPLPTSEDTPPRPASVYGLSKYYQEALITTTCAAKNIAYTALRFQNVYGPGQSLVNPYTGILSIFSNLIRSGKQINLFEDGRPVRDFVYIDDIVEALYLSLTHEKSDNQIFNVGTGEATDVLYVTNLLAKAYGKTADYRISGDFRVGDIRYNVADMAHIKSQLNFTPRVNIETGIQLLADWVLATSEVPQVSAYEDSLREMREKGLHR